MQVPRADSWITEEQFFAGLAVVQAMPGPLFNLSVGLHPGKRLVNQSFQKTFVSCHDITVFL